MSVRLQEFFPGSRTQKDEVVYQEAARQDLTELAEVKKDAPLRFEFAFELHENCRISSDNEGRIVSTAANLKKGPHREGALKPLIVPPATYQAVSHCLVDRMGFDFRRPTA